MEQALGCFRVQGLLSFSKNKETWRDPANNKDMAVEGRRFMAVFKGVFHDIE